VTPAWPRRGLLLAATPLDSGQCCIYTESVDVVTAQPPVPLLPPSDGGPSPARSAALTIAGSCVAVRLRVLNRAVTAIYDDALRPCGLKVSQMNVLVALAVLGPSEPARLCDLLHLERSTLSRNVKRMRRQGWLQTEPGADARRHLVSVTTEGLALIERAKPAWDEAQTRAASLLGDDGRRIIVNVGSRLMAGQEVAS
jgi:DNA-binding MarR family transcriptional regulator